MIQGTSSGAGKSFVVTALCRAYARKGLSVAPFKAQNMSNNARVTPWGEMGSAQYFQALAAKVRPDVKMNPVLLKPEADTQSQVVVMGQPDLALSRMPWHQRKRVLWPIVQEALHDLMANYDLVIIEGAGSPAEINLRSSDIVNMTVALEVNAKVVIITDIDRGGAFAHLYGTFQLLSAAEKELVKGFILNKFQGDATLLSPAPQMLESLTSVPTLGVLPMWYGHGLPEEDGVFDARETGQGFTVTIVVYPHISNLDEFERLKHVPGVKLSWAREVAQAQDSDLLILPGSKHVASDMQWMRQQGWDNMLSRHIEKGKPLLGICGGFQMLGLSLQDPFGVESEGDGLGIFPLYTIYDVQKDYQSSTLNLSQLSGYWHTLSGLSVLGYEIHHGKTYTLDSESVLYYSQHNVLGIYAHGLFENPQVLERLFQAQSWPLETVLEGLADFVEKHLPIDKLI